MARTSSQSDRVKRPISKPKAIIVSAVALICLVFAVPRVKVLFIDYDAPPPASMAAQFKPTAGGPVQRERPATTLPVVQDSRPPVKSLVVPPPTGDISAALELRWNEFEVGERVLAKVRITNRLSTVIYLPAGGEPNRGLAVVIEDAEGNEIRRVVETTKANQLPRRMAKLAPGADVKLPIVVIAEEDAPLAPGTYSAFAELTADPSLARLGLPIWTAPKGPVRTESVQFVVKPRSAK